jgi:hypothetical protein
MREPNVTDMHQWMADRIKRQRWQTFIAGRKESGDPEWRYYRPAGSPPVARRSFTDEPDEAA